MAAHYSLRRLVDSAEFSYLQTKLERFSDTYNINSNDENVNKCCEIIERNAKLQRQLFKLLNDVAAEGGLYSNARTLIRSRFYPYFYEDYYLSSARAAALLASSTTIANDLVVYETLARKNAEIEDLTFEYERNINDLENELNDTKVDNNDLRTELDFAQGRILEEKRKLNDNRLSLECEISDLRAKLKSAELKIIHLEPKASLSDDYERQIMLLKDEIRLLNSQNNLLTTTAIIRSRPLSPVALVRQSRARSRSSSPLRSALRSASSSRLRAKSPLARDNATQVIRQENLISRYNEMFARDRLDAMDILRIYSDDYENNQRIVFAALQEAFNAAKAAFSEWKIKVRTQVAITHKGPDMLEEAVQDYINRNIDLYDLPSMVSRVVSNLNINSKIHLPIGVNYSVISSFIREACRLAWHMTCLAYAMDISFALDAEVFDDLKYRRSYDSEFTAPLVNHHIWPCLVQGVNVVVKGEACTKRGAALNSGSRSASPSRKALKGILRSRSPSPCRSYLRSYSPSGYYY